MELDMARDEFKLMEAAVALAEELNFSRAARKLHITQPALTKQIAELEDRLGLSLFERDRRQVVAVNDSGRAYVEEARLSLLHGRRASMAARTAAQDIEATLNIGRSPYTDPFLTTTLLSIRLPLFPRLKIELSSQYSCELAHELLAGMLDLAIVTEPPESPFLTMVKVAEAPFYIAMSKRDQLAERPSVTLDAIAGRSWVLFERRLHPPVYDAVMQFAEQRKVMPAKVLHITTPEESYQFIADGYGVAFLVKAGALIMARNVITVRPLVEETLLLKTYLASHVDN